MFFIFLCLFGLPVASNDNPDSQAHLGLSNLRTADFLNFTDALEDKEIAPRTEEPVPAATIQLGAILAAGLSDSTPTESSADIALNGKFATKLSDNTTESADVALNGKFARKLADQITDSFEGLFAQSLSDNGTGVVLVDHKGVRKRAQAKRILLRANKYDIEVGPAEDQILIFEDIYVEDVLDLKFEEFSRENFTNNVAFDLTGLNYTNATYTARAKGTELYKCKEWNYAEQRCDGTWTKILDITPGETYTLELSPEDPALSEGGGVFFDGFENGLTTNWTVNGSGNQWVASTTDPFNGTQHAEVIQPGNNNPTTMRVNVSTLGFTGISVSYARRLIGIDAADEFSASWFDGTTWNTLEATGSGSENGNYIVQNFTLGATANDNSLFALEFMCEANAGTEGCRVDDVFVTSGASDICPGTINESTTLTSNITGTGNCITFDTNNIMLDCDGFSITYATTIPASGIFANNKNNITIKDCTLITGNSVNASNFAVRLTNTSQSSVINSSIVTNGTSNNHGILLESNSNDNTIENNTVLASGSANFNVGIYLLTGSSANQVSNNSVSASGTTSNHGILLQTSAQNNTILGNIIQATGSANFNVGIYLLTNSSGNIVSRNDVNTSGTVDNTGILLQTESVLNNITDNTVRTFGTSGSNEGIFLLESSSNNRIFLNRVVTNGTDSNHGIILENRTSSNDVVNNTVNTSGTGLFNVGIFAHITAQNNALENNTISTSGQDSNHGFFLTKDANNNTISFNNISVNGTFSFGIGIENISIVTITNNTLMTNVTELHIFDTNDTELIDPDFNNYSITNATLTVKKTGKGKIKFHNKITQKGKKLKEDLVIDTRVVFINTTNAPGLNQSADITFFNFNSTTPDIILGIDYEDDGIYVDCTTTATCVLLDNNQALEEVLFNVSHFTRFAIDIARVHVQDISQLPAQVFLNNTPELKTNSTAAITRNVDFASANLTLPSGEVLEITLINQTKDVYNHTLAENEFVQRGQYSITYFAQDTTGLANGTVTATFTRAAYNIIDPVNRTNAVLVHTIQVDANASGVLNLTVESSGTSSPTVRVIDHDSTSPFSKLGIDNTPAGEGFVRRFAVDSLSFDFNKIIINQSAQGTSLFECTDWNYGNQECAGNWKKVRQITQGQEYNATVLKRIKAGFAEGNKTLDLLDEKDFLINATETVAANPDGTTNVTLNVEQGTVKTIVINELNATPRNDIRVDTTAPTLPKFTQAYALDTAGTNFTNGTMTITARGTRLVKCADWNITTQTCGGNWVTIRTDLVPGQNYTIDISPGDPGFGEINATDAWHLDENRTIIENIFDNIVAIDGNFSPPIPHNDFARVQFAENLTNGSYIDFVARSNVSNDVFVEIYPINNNTIVGTSSTLGTSATHEYVRIGLPANDLVDTFDMRTVSSSNNSAAAIEYDFIHDQQPVGSTEIRQIIKDSGAIDNSTVTFVINFTQGTGGLPLQNISKAFLIISFQHANPDTTHAATFKSAQITSATELTIFSSSAALRNIVEFEYAIVEFTQASPIEVQRSNVDVNAVEVVTGTFSDVGNLSQTFLLSHGHSHNATETTTGCEEYDQSRLISTTTWELAVDCPPNSGAQDNRVEIIDWNDGEFIRLVQRGLVNMSTTSNLETVNPPTAVNRNHTLVLVSARSSAGGFSLAPANIALSATLNETGSIIIQRVTVAAPLLEIAWELVEFQPAAVRVQHVTLDIGSGVGAQNATILPVNTSRTVPFGTVATPFGHGGARSNDIIAGATQNQMFTMRLINATVVEVRRNASGEGQANLSLQIWEFLVGPLFNLSNITIGKIDNPDPVFAGNQLNYTIEVNSTGANTAFNVTVNDTYPPEVVFDSAVPSPLAGTNNTFIAGNLTNGTIFRINITVNVSSGVSDGVVINNTATVSFQNETSQVEVNRTVTEGTTVQVAGVLNVTADTPTPGETLDLFQNDTFSFNITVRCQGTGSCGEVFVAARYNQSNGVEPDTNISRLLNDTPFFIVQSRPDNDIVVALQSTTNELRLYEFSGGVWRETTNITDQPGGIEALEVGDADNDGLNEIVIGVDSDNQVKIVDFNETSSTWVVTDVSGPQAWHVEDVSIGDADNDGLNEIIAGFERTGTGQPTTGVTPLRKYDLVNGVWEETNITPSNEHNSVQWVDIGDPDDDGLNEVVALYANVTSDSGHMSRVTMYKNSTSPWIQINVTDLLGGVDARAERMIIGDIDNDGREEIISSHWDDDSATPEHRITLYENDTSANWDPTNISVGAGLIDGIDIGDANADGRIDLLVMNDLTGTGAGPNQVVMHENISGGFVPTNISAQLTGLGRDVSIGDANNDGRIDVIAAQDQPLILFENISGTQINTTIQTFIVDIDSADIADPDNDGRLNNLSCGIMNAGDICQFNYTIKATGDINTFWLIDANATSTSVESNDSANPIIHIIGAELVGFNFSNISVIKLDNPDPVNAGSQLNYTIEVNSTGNTTAFNVTVNDTYPSQVIFDSAAPQPLPGTNNTFILGNMTNGTSVLINITVNVSSSVANGTVINNIANATFQNETSQALASVTDSETTTVLGPIINASNISVIKTDNPDPVTAGSQLNYTINVTSTGVGVAFNVTVNDTYPSQVIFDSAAPLPLPGTNNTFILGNLTNGTSVLINITVNVSSGVSDGVVINNTVNVTFQNETSQALVNVTDIEPTTVLAPILFNLSNVSIIKTDNPDPVNAGAQLNYTINVTSTGNGTAFNVTVNDTYPSQVIFDSAAPLPLPGTNNTFILGNLTNGTSVLINITVNVSSSVANGTIINNIANATFQNETSQALASVTDSETTTVLGQIINASNISVIKTDNPDPVNAGSQLNYTINVTSTGVGVAFNVTVNDTYPSQVIFDSAAPLPLPGTNNTFILGNLTPGTSTLINITVNVSGTVQNGTVINNTVNATFQNETSQALVNVTDIEPTTVLAPIFNASNISVIKTDNPDPVDAGAQLNYTINVTSTGVGTAFNVTVNDTYPSQVIFDSAAPLPLPGTNNTFILGNMSTGDSILINITVNVSNTIDNGTVINNTVNATFQNETGNTLQVDAVEGTAVTADTPLVQVFREQPDGVGTSTIINVRFVVWNNDTSNVNITAATLVDDYPAGWQVTGLPTSPNATNNGNNVTFHLGALNTDEIITVNYSIRSNDSTKVDSFSASINYTFGGNRGQTDPDNFSIQINSTKAFFDVELDLEQASTGINRTIFNTTGFTGIITLKHTGSIDITSDLGPVQYLWRFNNTIWTVTSPSCAGGSVQDFGNGFSAINCTFSTFDIGEIQNITFTISSTFIDAEEVTQSNSTADPPLVATSHVTFPGLQSAEASTPKKPDQGINATNAWHVNQDGVIREHIFGEIAHADTNFSPAILHQQSVRVQFATNISNGNTIDFVALSNKRNNVFVEIYPAESDLLIGISSAIGTKPEQYYVKLEIPEGTSYDTFDLRTISATNDKAVFVAYDYIHDVLPIVENVTLSSTSGNNLSTENLTVVFDAADADGDAVKNITNWFVNETSITNLNMPFEGGSNSTFTKDYSGFDRNGIVVNATFNAAGGFDGFGAYEFNGFNSQIIGIPNATINRTQGSIEVYANPNDFTSSQMLVWAGLSTANGYGSQQELHLSIQHFNASHGHTGFTFWYGDNDIGGEVAALRASENYTYLHSENLLTGQYYHVVVTWDLVDQNVTRMYLNGTLVDENSTQDNPLYLNNLWQDDMHIGKPGTVSRLFNGSLDEIRIYDRALTSDQVFALFNNRTTTIVSNETKVGEVWQACVTPNDGTDNGTEVCSNNLTIAAGPPFSNLTVIKTDNPDPVNRGTQLNYTINVTSTGIGPTFNVTVNDTYPAQVIFDSAVPAPLAGTNNTFILGNMSQGDSILVNITVNVSNTIDNGTVINNTVNTTFQNNTGNTLQVDTVEATTVITPPREFVETIEQHFIRVRPGVVEAPVVGVLNITLLEPATNITTNVTQFTLFNVSANITCTNASCGNVTAFARFNTTQNVSQINEVFSGNATLNETTTDIPIGTTINDEASIFFFSQREGSDAPVGGHVSGFILNTTHLRFFRPNASPSFDIVWYVAEFTSGVRMYHGRNQPSSEETSIPIGGTVNTDSSFIVPSGYNATGSNWDENDLVRMRLINSTNIGLFVTSGGDMSSWQVVEFNGSLVQRDLAEMDDNTITANVTLNTPVDLNRSFLIFSYTIGALSGEIANNTVSGRIFNSTLIRFARNHSGQSINLSWEVVQLPVGNSVQQGLENFGSTETERNVTITPINLSSTVAFSTSAPMDGQSMGHHNLTTNDIPGLAKFTFNLTNTTNLRLTRLPTGSVAGVGWNVIEFGLGMQEVFVNISTGDGTTPFFTTSPQPQNCILNENESCQLNWTINATGTPVQTRLINVNASSNNTGVLPVVTDNATVRIIAPVIAAPSVVNLSPIAGTQFLLNETVNITANVTSNGTLDTVLANITLPNGTVIQVTLANGSIDIFNGTFSGDNLNQRGQYNITYFANDTQNNVNATITTNFFRNSLDVIDIRMQLLGTTEGAPPTFVFANYSTAVISNISGLLNLSISINDTRIRQVNVTLHDENSFSSILDLDDWQPTTGISHALYGINPDLFNFSDTLTVIVNATGQQFRKCGNWNFTGRDCLGNFTIEQNITPGQFYSFTVNSTDPGFSEFSPASDVALAPFENETFALAFIRNDTNALEFQLLQTNGTLIANVTIDTTVDTDSRVSIWPINFTHVAVSWVDGPDNTLLRQIFNRTGANTTGILTVDSNVGTFTDVSTAQIGDRFPICYANDADNDADFQIFNNTDGTQIVSETLVDNNIAPAATLQNLVECIGVNSTRFVYFWFDDQTNDASFQRIDEQGVDIGAPEDIDFNVGENAQVAITAVDNNKFVMMWYDSADQDITIAIRDIDNNVILAPTDIDTTAGTESRVAITALRNESAPSDFFVATWYNQSSDRIMAAVFNGTGTIITEPFTVANNTDSEFRLHDVTAKDPITGNTICPGKFIVAYSNSTDQGIFTGYDINGTPWNGICGRPDLFVNSSDILFNDSNPGENQNITINATIRNIGDADASDVLVQFFDNTSAAVQINGDITIASLPAGGSVVVNVTYIAIIGNRTILVSADPENTISESNETNNNATAQLNVQAYTQFFGSVLGNVTLDDSTPDTFYSWNFTDSGIIYFFDADTQFNFTDLQALGRNTTNGTAVNDFGEADVNLGMVGFNDSIVDLWATDNSTPFDTRNFTIFNRLVGQVPIINSSNASTFVTGILWDTGDDTNGEYDISDKEDLVFITNINLSKSGASGAPIDYEIHVPSLIRDYRPSANITSFVVELT